MPMCPNGHESETDDWCEICGMRMAAPASARGSRPPSSSTSASSASSGSSAPPVSPSPPSWGGPAPEAPPGVAELCPQCGTPREGGALFCEECRYNFRTHSATTVPGARPEHGAGQGAASAQGLGPGAGAGAGAAGQGAGPGAGQGAGAGLGAGPVPTAPGFPPYQRHESQLSRPSQINRPAEPVPSEGFTSGSGDFLLDPPSRPAAPPSAGTAAGGVAPPVTAGGAGAATGAGPDGTAFPGVTGASGVTGSPAAPAAPGVRAAGPEAAVPSGPVARTAWVAVVAADREYFTAMMARSGPDAEGLYFPAFSPEVRVPLTGEKVTIGRRRHRTGEAPDIDLSRAPEDPGVSHQHAMLVREDTGGWAVVDQDSTNGTTVNLGEDPIRAYTPVPLADGDRVHVGAWTTITVRLV